MQRWILYAVATFFGTGYAPLAPATVASFAFLAIWGFVGPVPLWGQLVLLAVVIAIGVPAATYVERREGKDPHKVVSDEVAGMLVTYLGVSTGWAGLFVGFLWFRLFDIGKPWPVRRLESLPEGWGITADDLMAGVYAHLALRLTLHFTGW
jgi:phosphatidylglycerophosphatase A